MSVFEIPTKPAPQAIRLQFPNGNYYTLRLNFNFRLASMWVLDISDANDAPLVCGIAVLPGVDLLYQYAYLGFGASLFAHVDGSPDAIPMFFNLGNTAHLLLVDVVVMPRPPFVSGFDNDNGVLVLVGRNSYPTSPNGLRAGAVWNNGGTVSVVSGLGAPLASARAFYYGQTTAADLLWTGGGNLPLIQPPDGTMRLWNNNGAVSIAIKPPPPKTYLGNDRGLLYLTGANNYPTSPAGLSGGQLWSNGTSIAVVPNLGRRILIAEVKQAPIYFGQITASDLLNVGGYGLPISRPDYASLQLWNNGGLICVA